MAKKKTAARTAKSSQKVQTKRNSSFSWNDVLVLELDDRIAGLRAATAKMKPVKGRDPYTGKARTVTYRVGTGVEEFIRANGTLMTPHPLPTGMSLTDVPKRYRLKACFAVAFRVALSSGGKLRYAEGYALQISGDSPYLVHHAWCVDAENRVIDLAWGGLAQLGIARAYLGIVFDLADKRFAKLWCKSLIDDSEHNWPLWNEPAPLPQGTTGDRARRAKKKTAAKARAMKPKKG